MARKWKRNLDGVYFRVERDGAYENVCFSDLNEDERTEMLKYWNVEELKRLCFALADSLRHIGDHFDIMGE